MARYEGKRAVVIGGTSGMGLATARLLRDEGVSVLVTGRTEEGVETARRQLGDGVNVVVSDATSLVDIAALGELVEERLVLQGVIFYRCAVCAGRGPIVDLVASGADDASSMIGSVLPVFSEAPTNYPITERRSSPHDSLTAHRSDFKSTIPRNLDRLRSGAPSTNSLPMVRI